MIQAAGRSNARKYANPNPVHQWLLRRFLERVTAESQWAVGNLVSPVLLDVGCGEGYVLEHLRRYWHGMRVLGVDGDHQALSLARKACPGATFLQSDARKLPFTDHSLDLITCLEVLEHLRDPALALAEMARVARRYILVSVPNQPYFALANLLRGRNLARMGDDPGHIHHWTASQFLALVRGQLSVMKLSYPFPWVLVLCHTKN